MMGINMGFYLFLPQSGFVQQENQQGHVTVGYVSLRYTILANHYLACYLGVISH
jgi:hypothetical protein